MKAVDLNSISDMDNGSALLHSVENSCGDHIVSHAMEDQSP